MHLDRLRPVFEQDGPFVTVHVPVGRQSEDAVSQRQARWTTIRHELEHEGVSPGLLAELERRLEENVHRHGEPRRTIVACGDSVIFDEVQGGRTIAPEILDVGPLPQLAPWIAAADNGRPFLLVVTDRTGADVSVHEAVAEPATEDTEVTGETFYITKVAEGDWAQKQFQNTAENTWKHNAGLVADEVRRLARQHRPHATLVAGETRARAELMHAFEHDVEALGQILPIESGGRAEGASDEALWDEVSRTMAQLQHEEETALLERIEQERGRDDRAAEGIEDVARSLAMAQVEHLVLDLDALAECTVPIQALEGVPLPVASADCDELPADRALVAAAALTGAQVSTVPAAVTHSDGAVALLRWS
jgi:hypothetical protein